VLVQLSEPIRESPVLDARLSDLIASVKANGLEGLVAKRRDSRYEPGQRSGAWQKMRSNQGQALVIAGYTVGARNFDAIIFGYYDGGKLLYAGRTRSGFTPASRDQPFKRFQALAVADCPFANLPERRAGRWGEGLTAAESMKECRWAQAVAGRAVRVRGMDVGRAPAAFPLYGPAGRQERAGRRSGGPRRTTKRRRVISCSRILGTEWKSIENE